MVTETAIEKRLDVAEERLNDAFTAALVSEWFLKHDPNTAWTKRWAKRRRNRLKARWNEREQATRAYFDERARRAGR